MTVHGGPPVGEVDGGLGLLGGHVVEEHRVGPGVEGLLQLVEVAGLHVDHPARPGPLRGGHPLRDAEDGEVVVLEHHPVREVGPVVAGAAGADRRLLERAQPRRRLARVPDASRAARAAASANRRVRVAMPERWQRKFERGALAGEDRRQRPADRAERRARRGRGAVDPRPDDLHRGVELCEDLGGAGRAGDDPRLARDEVGRGRRVGREQRGGEVAQRGEVLGQRTRDGLAHREQVGVGDGHGDQRRPGR